jgi:hypothetical protein
MLCIRPWVSCGTAGWLAPESSELNEDIELSLVGRDRRSAERRGRLVATVPGGRWWVAARLGVPGVHPWAVSVAVEVIQVAVPHPADLATAKVDRPVLNSDFVRRRGWPSNSRSAVGATAARARRAPPGGRGYAVQNTSGRCPAIPSRAHVTGDHAPGLVSAVTLRILCAHST